VAADAKSPRRNGDGASLSFQTATFPAPPNFRKFIFGGIEENQRVKDEKIWFFRISPPYLGFGRG
jgi:hypothetical protein